MTSKQYFRKEINKHFFCVSVESYKSLRKFEKKKKTVEALAFGSFPQHFSLIQKSYSFYEITARLMNDEKCSFLERELKKLAS